MRGATITLWLLTLTALGPGPAAAQCGRAMPIVNRIDSAIGVAETAHVIDVTLEPDLASIETRSSLRSSSPQTAEVSSSLTMSGTVVGFTVCAEGRCREARTDPWRAGAYMFSVTVPPESDGPVTPVGRVTPRTWGQSNSSLMLAPLSVAHPLDLTVRSVLPTQLMGGTVYARLFVTGLGVESVVRVRAPGLENVRIDGEVTREVTRPPNSYVFVQADLPSGPPVVVSERARCGEQRCRWTWIGSPRAGAPRDVIVLLDASSSMEDVGPERVQRALEGLRRAMPDGSTARVIAFGRTVETPVPEPVPAAALDPAALAALRLGNRTITAPIWPTVAAWVAESRAPLIVAVTDGRASFDPPDGVEFSVVELFQTRHRGAPDPYAALVEARGGQRVTLATALELEPAEPMEHRLRRLFAPVLSPAVRLGDEALAPLRAGEGRRAATLEAAARSAQGLSLRPRAPSSPRAPLLTRWLRAAVAQPGVSVAPLVAVADEAEEATATWRRAGLSAYPPIPGAVPVDHAHTVARWPGPCTGPTLRDRHPACGRRFVRAPRIRMGCAEVRGSLSRQSVQRMMNSARPAVNACLARARAGRRDWQARFLYEILIGGREVHSVRVTQRSPTVDDATVECLLARPIANLVVPGVENRDDLIGIYYPFSTQPDLPPARVRLDRSVDAELEGVFGAERADGEDL